MAAKKDSNVIQLTRIYDAPVKTVWEAWTDPEQTAQWWGPRGFTLTTHSKDLRPGGSWSYTMHGPDGLDYPNVTQYLEVEKYARLVYDHGANDERPPMFRVTVLFTDLQGKTKMEMSMALPTPEAAAATKKFVKKAGGDATWDRLGEFLEKKSSGKDVFVINRAFEAPIETLFDVWTDPKHAAQWFGPETMLTTVLLAEEGPSQTRVTVTWEIHGQATREEADTFSKAKAGMTQGWTGSFDKLEGYLGDLQSKMAVK